MSDHDPLTLKLSLREKYAYGMGDFGSNLMLCIGTLYLLKFYTDELGMPAYYGGIIFLVAKFFTAFTDMLTGVLLDSRRHIGAKGKFRPFILYASFPVALVASAQFLATDFTLTVKTASGNRTVHAVWPVLQPDELLIRGRWCPLSPETRMSAPNSQHGVRAAQRSVVLLCTVGFMPIQALFTQSSSLGYPGSRVDFLRFAACSVCGGVSAG